MSAWLAGLAGGTLAHVYKDFFFVFQLEGLASGPGSRRLESPLVREIIFFQLEGLAGWPGWRCPEPGLINEIIIFLIESLAGGPG